MANPHHIEVLDGFDRTTVRLHRTSLTTTSLDIGGAGILVGAAAEGQLTYADGRTVLENRCKQPVWLDPSVLLPGEPAGPVPANATTTIRDHNAFTLGVGGKLFRAVARAEVCEPS